VESERRLPKGANIEAPKGFSEPCGGFFVLASANSKNHGKAWIINILRCLRRFTKDSLRDAWMSDREREDNKEEEAHHEKSLPILL
jgi:hypothetical protein